MAYKIQFLWSSLKSIRRTHRLVVQSAVLGSILLSLFGFLVPPAQANRAGSRTTVGPIAVTDQKETNLSVPLVQNPVEKPGCELSGEVPDQVLQWCDLITHYAEANNLPPLLVAALIYQESGGSPLAFSKSGAVGLMQVMPRDGLAAAFQCQNGPCFADRPSRAELENPEFNVAYGTQMLAGLIGKYQNIRDALRAYGPMDMGYGYADIVLGLYDRFKSAK